MIISYRSVITRRNKETRVASGYWEAFADQAGAHYHGRSSAEAIGTCLLSLLSYRGSLPIGVQELPTIDQPAAQVGGKRGVA